MSTLWSRRSCDFFFNDTATTEIYTLSRHDALPICRLRRLGLADQADELLLVEGLQHGAQPVRAFGVELPGVVRQARSEEHTSELQSRQYLVCRLLLEKNHSERLYASLAHASATAHL